jgi:hypothetical protein
MKQEQTDAMRADVRTGAREGAIDRAAKYYSETQNLSQTLTRVYEAGYAAALEAGKAVDENGLKPCPFCGGEADLLKAKPDDAWPEDYVTCKNHDCDIFGNYSATVESWNRRAR